MNIAASSPAKTPWPKSEKSLLVAMTALAVLAALGVFYWIRTNVALPLSVPPPPAMPAQNAFDSFEAAASAETQGQFLDMADARPTSYSLSQAAAAIRANASALRLLRQGLTLPYQNPATRSFNILYPYYAHFRQLARLLHSEGRVRGAQGDWADAMGSALDSIQLGEKIPRGGTLIGEFVGIACQAIGRQPAWQRVDHLNAAQARAAARRLEQIGQSRVPLADVLQQEEWATQASLLETFRSPTWRDNLWNQFHYSYSDSDAKALPLMHAQIYLSSQRGILRYYTATMDGFVSDAHRPYAARPHAFPFDPLTREMAAAPSDRAGFLDALTQAENSLLLVTLTLRAYRLEHGAYPATLSALVPSYLTRVPDDPFAPSGPLHYKAQGFHYLLYSIGPDGKDDGGRAILPGVGRPNFVVADSRGDIVAGVNLL